MNAIDTNIWIYSHDGRDPEKQERAQELIAGVGQLALLWQVGCEFIAAARKLEPQGFTGERVWAALRDMQAMSEAILLPAPETWDVCCDLLTRTQLHFWDAMIVAACVRGGVRVLYSEDFSGVNDLGGVEIINPFV